MSAGNYMLLRNRFVATERGKRCSKTGKLSLNAGDTHFSAAAFSIEYSELRWQKLLDDLDVCLRVAGDTDGAESAAAG